MFSIPDADFLKGINPDDKIYRIMKYDYFLDWLKNRHLRLTSPANWEDPFENFLSNIDLLKKDGKHIDLTRVKKKYYCQCWSLVEESDLLWRVYSPNNLGVRLTTSVERYFEYIKNAVEVQFDQGKNEIVTVKIGKVEYKNQSDIEAILKDPELFKKKFLDENFPNNFLIKRKPFSSEKEVRLILNDFDDMYNEYPYFIIENVDFNFLERITFDPRIEEEVYKTKRDKIISLEIDENKIKKSDLYEYERLTLTLN